MLTHTEMFCLELVCENGTRLAVTCDGPRPGSWGQCNARVSGKRPFEVTDLGKEGHIGSFLHAVSFRFGRAVLASGDGTVQCSDKGRLGINVDWPRNKVSELVHKKLPDLRSPRNELCE